MRARPILIATSLGIAALAGAAVLNWQGIMLGLAVASSEQRPALLADAMWGKPGTALAFRRRFARGTSQGDLLAWLADNGFEVDRVAHRASHRVRGLPCNEEITVTWSAKGDRLSGADAMVGEAGCL